MKRLKLRNKIFPNHSITQSLNHFCWRRAGFTLLELLVVIAIIGILIAMGVASYSAAQAKSRDAKRKGDMKAIQNAFEQYYSLSTTSSYPLSCPGSGSPLTVGSDTFIIPTDPKNATGYTYSTNCPTPTSAYCYCAHLETTGGGNSTDSSCSFASSGDYFCVKNLQ